MSDKCIVDLGLARYVGIDWRFGDRDIAMALDLGFEFGCVHINNNGVIDQLIFFRSNVFVY